MLATPSHVLGQILEEQKNLTGNKFNFNISNHAAGMYFIEVTHNGVVKRTKLLKL
jgi:hypothetical protein